MCLVKHIYLILTIKLIRLLWLSCISKLCVSFADKYRNKIILAHLSRRLIGELIVYQ